jgi:short-subunit dehydrogenase
VRAMAVNPGPVPTEWQAIADFEEGPERLPGVIEADQVVRESLAAYDAGNRAFIPGRTFRWFMRASSLGPRAVQLRVAERMYRK